MALAEGILAITPNGRDFAVFNADLESAAGLAERADSEADIGAVGTQENLLHWILARSRRLAYS